MRTTITIDDRLLEQLKCRATEARTTVSKLIEDAVRLSLLPKGAAKGKPQFQLLTFGEGNSFTLFNIDKASELIELDDLADFGRA